MRIGRLGFLVVVGIFVARPLATPPVAAKAVRVAWAPARIRSIARAPAAEFGVPVALLVKLAHVESRGRWWAVRIDGEMCDVGAWQIRAHCWGPLHQMLATQPERGAWYAAMILKNSRVWCRTKSSKVCPCPWARWNWGARSRVCRALRGSVERLRSRLGD